MKNGFGILLAVVYIVSEVNACGSPEDRVTIGKPTQVCLVKDATSFIAIEPSADSYSRITVLNSYSDLPCDSSGPLFSISSLGVSTGFRKTYCSLGNYFPILTAVINVDMGVVKNISWDDGCYFTDDGVSASIQSCAPNAYSAVNTSALTDIPAPANGHDTALTKQSCDGNAPNFCDLAVYVAWVGRDSAGNYMGSAGRRFSIFRNYALDYQQAAMDIFL